MLTLTREEGQTIFLGRKLSLSDLDGSCDFRVDINAIDNRVGRQRVQLTISDRFDIGQHVLTPAQPDLDFAPDIRLAFLSAHEFLRDGRSHPAARIGIQAPRDVRIVRDDANSVLAANRGAAR